ncbi:helix-turn-helix domain-containing protein [Streptomyces chartreusis]|uniref:helix-turn-helix domain-containing protein n=1 Tax=Streptomyces chartreusis TaxID=1969 RepID=UPI003721A7E7
MADDRSTRAELGAFLKARRAELTPAAVGLADDGTPRRVPGLRREEVARLASISVDYYSRIEQGRLQVSATVLGALARALRLDAGQQTYLHELAGKPTGRRIRRGPQRVRPSMYRLLDQLDRAPAMVLGRFNDILAWNAAAAALYLDFAQLSPQERNYTRLLFLNRGIRDLHVEWEAAARLSAATLRLETAGNPDDARLADLVGELSVRSPEFRQWWGGRIVSSASYGTKLFQHPLVGQLTLECDTWASPDDPDKRLMVLTAEPGSPSDEALQILISWSAEDASTESTS